MKRHVHWKLVTILAASVAVGPVGCVAETADEAEEAAQASAALTALPVAQAEPVTDADPAAPTPAPATRGTKRDAPGADRSNDPQPDPWTGTHTESSRDPQPDPWQPKTVKLK
jgi:pyruvate/2-oxoglutarate dehydrogenase complex dihydrolipoamide acyltransferase (E2) component